MWKKILISLVFLALLVSLPAGKLAGAASGEADTEELSLEAVAPADPETTAKAAVLLEPSTNMVIYDKESDKRLPMASVTKLMTLLLAAEAVERGELKLEDKVVTSENAWEMGGSQVYLEPGEEMSLWEMLTAVGLQSANDASVAVAEHIAGSEEAFVQAMNEKVKELGLVNTNFVNCHGLTADNHYTSAYDMAEILKEGLKYPLFSQITSMKEADLRGGLFKLWNTNKLLWWYNGADSGKTGWTEAADYCLVSSAERDGLRMICVVLGTAEPESHFRESSKLLDYGFARYKAVNMAEKGAVVGTVKVGKGQAEHVEAQTAEKVSVVTPKGEEKGLEAKAELQDLLDAPVQAGQIVGSYIITKDGQEVKRVDLLAGGDVLKTTMLQQIKRVVEQVF